MKKTLLALSLFCTLTAAQADTTEYCTNYSNFVYSVAKVRDAGVQQAFLIEQVFATIDAGTSTQFTKKDKVEIGRIATILYNRPDVVPEVAAKTYYQHCLETTTDI